MTTAYTTNNTYTVPANCIQIGVVIVGGGGGAAAGSSGYDGYYGFTYYTPGDPGIDGAINIQILNVSPGNTYSIAIGLGGSGGVDSAGGSGNTTTFTGPAGTFTAAGGAGGAGSGDESNSGTNGQADTKANSTYNPYGRGGAGVFGSNGQSGQSGVVYVAELYTIPNTNTSLSKIKQAFGSLYGGAANSTPIKLSNFYNVKYSVPASGAIKFSDLKGKNTKTEWVPSTDYTNSINNNTFSITKNNDGTVSLKTAIIYFGYGYCGSGYYPGWTLASGYQQMAVLTPLNYTSTTPSTSVNLAGNFAEQIPDLSFYWRKGCACGNDQTLTSYFTNIKASGSPNSAGIEMIFSLVLNGQQGC